MGIIGLGETEKPISDEQVRDIVTRAAEAIAPGGKRILAIIPDHTRSCPLPLIVRELHRAIAPEAKKLDFLVALGTHPPLSKERLEKLLGIQPGLMGEVLPGSEVFNHQWDNPDALAKIGTLAAGDIESITEGRFSMDIDVTINRKALDYDLLLVAGPVFPHEVVGFSGGDKYFFPGICGPELLNFFHWLGAVITCPKIIGTKHTPVRDTLAAAADMIRAEKLALCMVVKGHDLAGLYFGEVRDAWSAAVDLSQKLHVVRCSRAYDSILARAPEMYDDIWTAGKCMYKMEPVVADGGELIIYAPHVTEISYTHGRVIDEIGYHTRDFFVAQWDAYKHYPWGVIAHSTHVKGIGTYENGVETPRVTVTLATGIPEERCRQVNLGYRDPATIDPAEWEGRDDRLYVPRAGEMLHKLADPPDWQKFE